MDPGTGVVPEAFGARHIAHRFAGRTPDVEQGRRVILDLHQVQVCNQRPGMREGIFPDGVKRDFEGRLQDQQKNW